MPARLVHPWSAVADQDPKSIPEVLADLRELVVNYAKQEVVEPIKGLGTYLKWGLLGSVAFSFAGVFLALALLRGLQTETGTHLTGNWSWVPYVATLAAAAVFIVVLVLRIGAKRKESR